MSEIEFRGKGRFRNSKDKHIVRKEAGIMQ
jgi:hypothetical protein